MLGCLRKVGCLVLLGILAAAAWFSRESWWPRRAVEADSTATEPAIAWEPITEEGAARARRAIEALGRRSGPVFANIRPGDLVGAPIIARYAVRTLTAHHRLPTLSWSHGSGSFTERPSFFDISAAMQISCVFTASARLQCDS